MTPLAVHIKHAGKTHDVTLDPDRPPSAFKDSIYQVTGVPPDRMKVMIKGGVLKDDTDWKKVGPKEGQSFTVIGAAGELPKPPAKPIVFLEDMDDSELAEALAKPVGLKNLGNTCYMNATVQALRAIPELQAALSAPHAANTSSPLPKALATLYDSMGRTTDAVVPGSFLQVLRIVVPQFGEIDRNHRIAGMAGYAQQDAEECWGQITNALKEVPLGSGSETSSKKFVESYMMGQMRRELKCDEAPEESVSVSSENVLKIECNISNTTNYMLTGIMNSLDQKVEKTSPTLGREAMYSQKSRLTRLPTYLTLHMVRFAWRRDIGKKAKIMRKVKFPLEFDALDLVTDELKAKLLPISRRLKDVERERQERRKVRKRTKTVAPTAARASTDVEMADTATSGAEASGSTSIAAGTSTTAGADEGKGKEKAGGELEEENVYREKEAKELEALISPELQSDVGCSVTGLYDLVAIVTHKGAAADAGHYIGFVKKSVFHGAKAPSTDGPAIASPAFDEDDEDWYKFDDDKVSVFPKEKLATLDGGGEDSSAYVLLYKSKSLA